jgi:hypothetical protein
MSFTSLLTTPQDKTIFQNLPLKTLVQLTGKTKSEIIKSRIQCIKAKTAFDNEIITKLYDIRKTILDYPIIFNNIDIDNINKAISIIRVEINK